MQVQDSNCSSNLEHLQKTLHQILQKLDRKLKKQQEELEEAKKHLWYKQIADSILASPQLIPRKESKITITNIHTQKEEIISLNPKFDAQTNAQLFYKKAKRAKRGEEISIKKVDATQEEIKKLTLLSNDIELSLKESENKDIHKELEERFNSLLSDSHSENSSTNITHHTEKEKIPFRHFVTDGWDFFVGKSDSQNDELSIHFAHPSDVWMHVAGYAGSHVVIRRPKDKAFPPPEILQKAAALAIWFSKAKHTSYCEVNYTEARFVHKRRHAPAGEVIAERCKTIRLSPKSPQELFKTPFLED